MTDRIIGPDRSFQDGDSQNYHGTAVCVGTAALLFIGPSGCGKSGLALQMMGMGARLVADDQTILTRKADAAVATSPAPIQGRIEARGIGLLAAETQTQAYLRAVVDLETVETDRLPPHRTCRILGLRVPLLHKVESPYFAAGLMQYLKGGRCD